MAKTPDTTPTQPPLDLSLEQSDPSAAVTPDYNVPTDQNQKGEFDYKTWANQTPAEYKSAQEGLALIRATVAAGKKAKRGQ